VRIGAGSGRPYSGRVQRRESLVEPRKAPVDHVIVREDTRVDPRGRQHADILRVHSVVDSLPRPSVFSHGHARFEIDDPRRWREAREHTERDAPDVLEADVPRDRAIQSFRQAHVCARVTNIGLEEPGRARRRQDLVDPSAGHHVASQKQPYGSLSHRWH
jgi:hypothetical protein